MGKVECNWWMFQEEKCDANYVKDCFIKYEKGAVNITTKVCRKPLVRDCDVGSSEEICSTEYETECVTREMVHQVREGCLIFIFVDQSSSKNT